MTTNSNRNPNKESQTETMLAHVQCANFRCLAYRKPGGQWRDYYQHELLPEPVQIVEVVSTPPPDLP